MTFTEQQFRLTGYLPRSLQSNPLSETDILVPGPGAPHTEEFRLATATGIPGYRDYLKLPEGRRGTFDPLREQYEQGSLLWMLIDPKTAFGQEAQRFVTAYIDRLATARMFAEWREHPADSWTPWWTGRVKKPYLAGLNLIGLQMGDMSDDLDYEIGAIRPSPSATGVVAPTLLPYAVSAPYGTLAAYNGRGRLTGTVKSHGTTRYIELDARSAGRPDNIVSRRLVDRAKVTTLPLGLAFSTGAFAAGLRLRFSATSPAITEKEVIPFEFKTLGADGPPRCTAISFVETPSADPFHVAIDTTTIPDGTTVSFDVREDTEPVTLVATSTVRLAKEIFDGLYGPRTPAGVSYRAIARDPTSFSLYPTGLLNSPADLAGRWTLTKRQAPTWLQQNLLQPAMLGYRFDGSGAAEIFSWARPTSLAGLTTLTDLDLAAPRIDWEQNADGGKTDFYVQIPVETKLDPQRIGGRADEFPDLPIGLLSENPVRYKALTPLTDQWGSVDLKPSDLTIEGNGMRYMTGELSYGGVSKEVAVAAFVARLSETFGALYGGRGPQYMKWKCRRTANTVNLKAGMWCIADFTWTPNTGSLVRGGARLALLTRVSEVGLTIECEAIDAGPNVLATAPTLGAASPEAGNTRYGFTLPVTLNGAGEPVLVWVNYTSQAVGTRPAADDPGWMPAFPAANAGSGLDFRVRATGTHTFRVNPPGKRAWLRGQTMSASSGGTAKLPSTFVFPSSGPGYVDLDPIPAPSAVAVTGITAKAARVGWTPGDPSLPTVVLLGSGASQAAADASTPAVVSPQLFAGADRFDLTGLDLAGPWWRCQVAHISQWGDLGPVAGTTPTSFQATGTAVAAPTPAAIILSRGGSTTGPIPQSSDGIAAVGKTGVEVILVPGPTGIGYDARVYGAVETAVGSGTYSSYALLQPIVPGELIQAAGYAFRDYQPQDGRKRRYKFTLIGPGTTESAESNVVEDVPGWLPILVSGTTPSEPVLGQRLEIVLTQADFQPSSSADAYTRSATSLLTSGQSYTFFAVANVRIPAGVSIDSIEMRGAGVGAGNALHLEFYEVTDAAATTTIASAAIGNTGTLVSVQASCAAFPAKPSCRYVVVVQMDAGAGGLATLDRVSVFYVPRSFTQVRQ